MEKTIKKNPRSVLYMINAAILAAFISASLPATNRTLIAEAASGSLSRQNKMLLAAPAYSDAIGISQRTYKYFLTERCADVLRWEEVVMRNRVAAEKINSMIRREALRYKLIDEDAGARCSRQMEYKQECSVVYTNHDLISVYLSSYTYFKGTPNGWNEFSTLNFDASSGKRISFSQLFDSSSQRVMQLMLSNKLRKLYPDVDDDPEHWMSQFSAPDFRFGQNGITVLLHGVEYGTSVEILLEYAEIKAFVNQDGPLKTLYSRLQ